MKKPGTFEMKIYEMLGIVYFRKLVFALERFIHRKDKGQNINYHIPQHDVESFDAFTKYLFYNGAIHVRNVLVILAYFLGKLLWLRHLQWFDWIVAVVFLKDVFCIILQRYNHLRIQQRKETLIAKRNQTIQRVAARIDLSAVKDYSHAEIEQDLLFVRRLRNGIAGKHSIILTVNDVEKLNRLSQLINSREQQRE